MSYTVEVERAIAASDQEFQSQDLAGSSSGELVSYAVCCIVQGLIGAMCFALVVFASGAAHAG